jgi:hypothetical protein
MTVCKLAMWVILSPTSQRSRCQHKRGAEDLDGIKWEWKEDERSDEMNTRTWKSGATTFVCSLSASRSKRYTLAPTSRNSSQSLYSDLARSTSAMGPRAVPSQCTNLRGNHHRQAGAMRMHRPCAVRLCNSAAWVRTGAWRCRRPPHPLRGKPPSLWPYRTWPPGPAPPPAGCPAMPSSEAAVLSQSPPPTAMSSPSEVV